MKEPTLVFNNLLSITSDDETPSGPGGFTMLLEHRCLHYQGGLNPVLLSSATCCAGFFVVAWNAALLAIAGPIPNLL